MSKLYNELDELRDFTNFKATLVDQGEAQSQLAICSYIIGKDLWISLLDQNHSQGEDEKTQHINITDIGLKELYKVLKEHFEGGCK